MMWVLFLLIMSDDGNNLTTYEFLHQQDCEKAAEQLEKDFNVWGTVHTSCVERQL